MSKKNWDKVANKEYIEMQHAYETDTQHQDDWSDLRRKAS